MTYGKFKEKTDQYEVETAYLGSTLGSTEGNVNMTAGRDVTIKGSEVIVKGDMGVQGENILLEKGDPASGLAHIVQKHATEFAKIGVPESKIPSVLFQTQERGVIIGEQGTRPIYEAIINGQKYKLSITVGSNGYLVGANLHGRIK